MSTRDGPSARPSAPGPSPAAVTPAHLVERILKSRSAVEGERKDVTILFADIVDSTRLIEHLDPDDASDKLEPALRAMIDAVHRFEGMVTRTMGDGIMALFGAPLAHEDHAVRASMAGLAMRDAVARLSDKDLAIRVGLHSGQVLIRSINNDLSISYDVMGEAVHLAARMEQLCEPGQVRCSEATEKLIHGFVGARALGTVAIKGLSRPVEVYELSALRTPRTRWQVRAARGLTRLVGRAEEIATLQRALARARSGDGQVVAIVGDAGVGKSRLAHEFLSSIEGEDILRIDAAALPENRSVPYLAATQLLRTWLGVNADDSAHRIARRLRQGLEAIDPLLLSFVSAYAQVLKIDSGDELWVQRDPDERRRIIQRALRALLLRLAEARPIAMVAEDLHWLDDETLSVLDGIVEALGAARILLVVTYRLDHVERWSAKGYFSRLLLEPLTPEETAAFLDAALGSDPALDGLKRMIAERAAGTPLFVEELISHLAEIGALEGARGQYRITGDVDPIEIPQTVQTVIAARIDRLPPESKDALQAAAIIGTAVPAPLLAAVMGLDDEGLQEVVAPLQEHGFLFETRILPESEYTFKHSLVRDVARGTVSRRRATNLHLAVVSSIEARYHNILDRYLDQLAYHAERAQRWDQAVTYAERAAERALDLSAYRLCARHLDNALRALDNLPESRERLARAIDLRLALRAPLGALGDIDRMHERLAEARELARSLDDDARTASIAISQAFAYNYTGDLAQAKETGAAGLELARRLADDELAVAGAYHLAQSYLWSGDYAEAIALLTPVLDLARGRFREQRLGTAGTTSVLILGMLGMAEAYVGRFADAAAHNDEALAIADRLERPYDQAIARWYKGFAQSQHGDQEAAISLLEDAFARCDEAEIVFLRPVVATSLGFSYANAGRLEAAAEVLGTALAEYRETGLRYGVAYASLNLAFTAMQTGDAARLAALLRQATELAVEHGFAGIEVAARRLEAIAARLAGSSPEDATAAAERSLALAEAKGMGPDVAHSHLVLARLYGGAGETERAREHAERALALYRDMGMSRWLERASKMLGSGDGR